MKAYSNSDHNKIVEFLADYISLPFDSTDLRAYNRRCQCRILLKKLKKK